MSRELEILRGMAREERRLAWSHAKLVPGRFGDAAGAFAKRHPVLTTGAAAALTVGLITRHQRRTGAEPKSKSMPLALAAMAAQFLPDVLHLVGLTVPKPQAADDRHEHCEGGDESFANSTARAHAPAERRAEMRETT
jgi:hypothetical protein